MEAKMTREEILAMVADGWGLKLSSAVATEVMGWHRHSETSGWIDSDGNEKAHWRWSPETDILAAWKVLKKLSMDYWCIDIGIAGGCRVVMEVLRNSPVRVELDATSFEKLPEAICKAALLAKLELGNVKDKV